jgi:hypothetical protein
MAAGLVAGAVLLLISADDRSWRVIGSGGGGAQSHPTISPHDESRVLVACDMTGSYLTQNAGAS